MDKRTQKEIEDVNWSGLEAYSIVDENNELERLGKRFVLNLIFSHLNF